MSTTPQKHFVAQATLISKAPPRVYSPYYPVTCAMREAVVDKRTAIDIYQWLREICSSRLLQSPQIVLGGPGVVIHIDESLFRHKPKVGIIWSCNKIYCTHSTLEQQRPSYNTRDLGIRDG